MPRIKPSNSVTRLERKELAAQRMACSLLVKGGESALFRFGLGSASPADPKQAETERRAIQITREILASWRATLDILQKLEAKQSWPDVETLEGWMQVDPALADEYLIGARFWSES